MPTTVGVHHASIEHDHACDFYRGRDCNCVPDISVSGPDGVIVVDERGRGQKVARQ
jgi:hypothetical protein